MTGHVEHAAPHTARALRLARSRHARCSVYCETSKFCDGACPIMPPSRLFSAPPASPLQIIINGAGLYFSNVHNELNSRDIQSFLCRITDMRPEMIFHMLRYEWRWRGDCHGSFTKGERARREPSIVVITDPRLKRGSQLTFRQAFAIPRDANLRLMPGGKHSLKSPRLPTVDHVVEAHQRFRRSRVIQQKFADWCENVVFQIVFRPALHPSVEDFTLTRPHHQSRCKADSGANGGVVSR